MQQNLVQPTYVEDDKYSSDDPQNRMSFVREMRHLEQKHNILMDSNKNTF